jgi:hypothetical protein
MFYLLAEENKMASRIDITTDDELYELKKIKVKNTQFIPHIELKGLTDVFNSYATKKTIATGFFNFALVSLNFLN